MTIENLNVGTLTKRGWARSWIEPLLGPPTLQGAAKLWPVTAVVSAEQRPIFIEACGALRELLRHAKYQNALIERQALDIARARVEGMPAVATVERPVLTDSDGSHVRRLTVAGGIELTFASGLRVSIPQPFLDALQRTLGVNAERFAMGCDLVMADWEAARTLPKNAAHGRAFFLGGVRYALGKLAAMEMEAPQHVAAPAPNSLVLH